jgi:UDP-N-acetylglucosamine--N-acetylmuramyl-(pentapeptide) pyrophosphoryl-undecaprenol N-acetylglucosamine transferase
MKNAYTYARTGACQVIEEKNFKPHVLTLEIERILDNPEIAAEMKVATKSFGKPDAARIIAEEVLRMAQEHK